MHMTSSFPFCFQQCWRAVIYQHHTWWLQSFVIYHPTTTDQLMIKEKVLLIFQLWRICICGFFLQTWHHELAGHELGVTFLLRVMNLRSPITSWSHSLSVVALVGMRLPIVILVFLFLGTLPGSLTFSRLDVVPWLDLANEMSEVTFVT